jgi:uncharacterized radical SAM superfamily protein
MSDSPKLALLEVGTRWAHYAELRELFACGVEILSHLTIVSGADQTKLRDLEGAVRLLDTRINLLADYVFQTTYGSKLRQVIDGDVDNLYRKMKRERENAAKETKPESKPPDADREGPADYTTK